MRLLLAQEGVDPDFKDNDYGHGQTPLSLAAENGRTTVVELLLATEGVDPDSGDRRGFTPLLSAAAAGHETVAKLLLAKDVNPDSRDNKGRTPLSWAAGSGKDAVVKLLLATKKVDHCHGRQARGMRRWLSCCSQRMESILTREATMDALHY